MPMKQGDAFVPHTFDTIYDAKYEEEHRGRARKISLENGNTVHIRCEDPFGFWKVSLDKGNLPERLKGSYTDFQKALAEVNTWLRAKPEPYVPSKETKKNNIEEVLKNT